MANNLLPSCRKPNRKRHTCPKCNKPESMIFDVAIRKFYCYECGYTCKREQLNDGGAVPPITKVMGILAIFL